MPQVDPKFTFWFGVWTNVLMLIAGYGIEHAPPLVAQYAPSVQWFASLAAQTNSVILTALVGISSTKPGPLINVPSITSTVVKILLVAFVLSAFLAGDPASAQLKTPQQVVNDIKRATGQTAAAIAGKPAPDPAPVDVWKAIMAAALPDLVYSSALSNSAGTPASKVRKQCWDALIAVNKQSQGTDLKDDQGNPLVKPDPHFFTDVELLAETIDNLSPTGPLFTSCAGAAEMAKMSVLQFINTAVTGAAGFAAMGL